MPDVQTQLRQYGRQLDELAPYPSPADIVSKSDPALPSRALRLRAAWVFTAAFLFTVGIVGSIWLLPADEPVAEVVAEPGPSIDFESLVWTRTPISELFGEDSEVRALTSGGPGFIAVGFANEDAAVWTSPDAHTWTRLPQDYEVFGGSEIADVTIGGPGLVAVGQHDTRGGIAPAVWTSPDGLTWSRVVIEETSSETDGNRPRESMESVASGGPGLVAVGHETKTLEGAWNFSTVGRVWTSPDGVTWTQIPHDPEMFGHATSYETSSSINQVVSGGPGFVAIGTLNGDAAVWTSPDGLAWTPTTEGLTWTSSVIDGGFVHDVVAGGPGLVAVGGYELDQTCKPNTPLDCYAAVWTSADGITWDPVPHDDAVFGGGPDKQGMSSVTSIGTDLVAVGSGVWTSDDGTNWTRIYHDPGFAIGEHSGMRYVFGARGILVVFGEAALDTNYVYLATEQP